MSATVDEVRFRGVPGVALSSGPMSATFLPDLGMTGVSLQCDGHEHLALPGGLSALRGGHTLGLPLLAPWANRLARRRYRSGRVSVDLTGLPLHTDGNGLPMHGLLVGRPGWRVERTTARAGRASARAAIDVDSPAFPFPHRIEVAVAVKDRGLTVDTTVVPTARRAVPIAFGWHPYLRLPGSPRRRWRLRLPGRTHALLDERGIPTGEQHAERAEDAPIGGRTFDDLYVLGRDGLLEVAAGEHRLSMRAGRGYRCAQVWVPAGKPFVALEPMTAPTNSLVEGSTPTVAPGDRYTATFTLTVEDR